MTGEISYKVREYDRGVFHPELDENFFVSKDHQQILEILNNLSENAPQNMMLVGPQGCGKTELAVWFAAKYNRPIIIMNCATIREAKDWFGYRDAKDGSIFWHKSDFVRALEMGNAVILLDEFNRLHTTLHNSLYSLLDARRSAFLEELGEVVKVGPGTVFFSTANIGFSHVGTFTMDSAMEDRWGLRLNVSFLPAEEEKKVLMKKVGISEELANKLVKFANDIRAKSSGTGATLERAVSTRQLLQTAQVAVQMALQGYSVSKAFDYTIVPFYSDDGGRESEQAQILQLIQGIFGA